MPTFENIINGTGIISTTNRENFYPQDSAKLFALIFVRFGRNLESTRRAIGRLLQNDPGEIQVAQLVAAGIAILEDEKLSYYNQSFSSEERNTFLEKAFSRELYSILKDR